MGGDASGANTRGGRTRRAASTSLLATSDKQRAVVSAVVSAVDATTNDADVSPPTSEQSAAAVPDVTIGLGPQPIGRGRPARAPLDWRAIASMPGVTLAAQEITDGSTGSSGFSSARSLRTHSSLQVTLDLDTLLGWSGATVFVQHKSKTGRDGSGASSMMQNFSNIDADDFRALGEAWIEQRLLGDRLRIKAGRIDFNSEFAGTDNGGSFLNASMGYSPSIAAAPTYPLPTSGVNVFVSPRQSLTLSVGVFNGLDGAPAPARGASRFRIAQASQQWTLGGAALPGRLSAGAWQHTGMFAAFDAPDDAEVDVRGTHGWYSTVDQALWQGRERANGDSRAQVAAFAQHGNSDRRVQGVHAHNGGGLTFAGMSAHRPSDVLGAGITHAGWRDGNETVHELFYEFPLTSHLSFVADLQRVSRRAENLDRRIGTVTTLRSIISF